MTRRRNPSLWLFAMCFASMMLAVPAASTLAAKAAPRLHVFVPTGVQPRALKRVLSESLDGVDVAVFGRHKDFERAQKSHPPDAAISLRPVLNAMAIRPQLQGVADGRATEAYVLLSLDSVDSADLTARVIGAVDLFGRRRMREFLGGLLSIYPAPKYKPVTKTDDLLPLLQFKSADVVLLPARLVPQFKRRTTQTLEAMVMSGVEVGLPAAAAFTERGKGVLVQVRSLPAGVNGMLGVEQWRAE